MWELIGWIVNQTLVRQCYIQKFYKLNTKGGGSTYISAMIVYERLQQKGSKSTLNNKNKTYSTCK